ncbi:hypothetical protein EJ04DRAFT_584147 [Polyplosphaeria fusca]|uniref:Uncharacterized protein n=1 Tax=Polyplosphaeria fusca TaxID=682080 RepID=A0A9P4QUD9_9PLEO|nr:hypothetical protein EJ04DRAFT_584147 [Polyplosphaeria fusca]
MAPKKQGNQREKSGEEEREGGREQPFRAPVAHMYGPQPSSGASSYDNTTDTRRDGRPATAYDLDRERSSFTQAAIQPSVEWRSSEENTRNRQSERSMTHPRTSPIGDDPSARRARQMPPPFSRGPFVESPTPPTSPPQPPTRSNTLSSTFGDPGRRNTSEFENSNMDLSSYASAGPVGKTNAGKDVVRHPGSLMTSQTDRPSTCGIDLVNSKLGPPRSESTRPSTPGINLGNSKLGPPRSQTTRQSTSGIDLGKSRLGPRRMTSGSQDAQGATKSGTSSDPGSTSFPARAASTTLATSQTDRSITLGSGLENLMLEPPPPSSSGAQNVQPGTHSGPGTSSFGPGQSLEQQTQRQDQHSQTQHTDARARGSRLTFEERRRLELEELILMRRRDEAKATILSLSGQGMERWLKELKEVDDKIDEIEK